MLVIKKGGSPFASGHRHVAFAVQVGADPTPTVQKIMKRGFLGLSGLRGDYLGRVISREIEGVTFHALVCASDHEKGWENAPPILEGCLKDLALGPEEEIALFAIGTEPHALKSGADPERIAKVLHESRLCFAVFAAE